MSWDSGACPEPDERELGDSALQYLDNRAIWGLVAADPGAPEAPPGDELARRRLRRQQRPS